MKKSILLPLLAVPAIMLTSCLGGGDDKITSSIGATMVQMKNNFDGTSSLNSANYRFDIDFTDGVMDITIYDEDIYGAAFVLNDIPMTANSSGYMLRATNVIPTDASGNPIATLDISDLYGQYYNTLDLRFTVNGSTTITAIPSTAVYNFTNVVTKGESTEYKYEDCTITLKYTITDEESTVDMTLNNIKFVDNMPTQQSMTFPDINVSLSSSGNSLVFAGESIIPEISQTPNPAYTITNFNGTLNPAFNSLTYFSNEYMVASFDCMNMDVDVTARMYSNESSSSGSGSSSN